jgi:hypothetical protein
MANIKIESGMKNSTIGAGTIITSLFDNTKESECPTGNKESKIKRRFQDKNVQLADKAIKYKIFMAVQLAYIAKK